jgi:digeranylgeranylglycerophospholipid reductase
MTRTTTGADRDGRLQVAVLGGAVGGLAAAERFREFADVTLFERQSYADKRVNCGEAINEASLVPLAKTAENGFLNRVEAFSLEVQPGVDRDPAAPPLSNPQIRAPEGWITDRNVVERRWAERLRADGVDVREGENVTVARYRDLVEAFDLVVDATGQPALSLKAAGRTDSYTGDIVALNADVAGDFTDHRRRPRIVFEGYTGYFWVFPKSDSRANVGIGWAGTDRPDDYVAELWGACDRAGVPRPSREATAVYTIPHGPSLAPAATRPEPGVYLVGDAAGIANRYQGEGICQAIRSATLLGDLVSAGRGEDYPRRLYRSMRDEYRLAELMRGVWAERRDPETLAAVAAAMDGLTVDDVTRRPRRVLARVLRRPGLVADLLTPGMVRRTVDVYTDRWEYGRGVGA